MFLNADDTPRMLAIWDQTVREGTPPEHFIYGTEYSREDINEALKSDYPLDLVQTTDEIGHGTFAAALAGGNIDDANDFTGIAPEARFIIVKLKQAKQYLRKFYRIPDKVPAFQENDIMLAMTYLGYKAGEVYTPLSVYLGLGTSSGDHNGDSPLSTVIKTLGSYRGVCISVAAGNEGNQGHHYLGNVDMNRYEDVEIRVGENDEGFTLELWAVTPNLYSVAIISPSGEISDRVRPRSDHTITISYVLEPTTIYVSYENPETSTGNELVLMRFTTLISGVWRIRVYNETNSGS